MKRIDEITHGDGLQPSGGDGTHGEATVTVRVSSLPTMDEKRKALPKPSRGERTRAKAAAKRAQMKETKAVRAEVFRLANDRCQCCGRRAQSMHEVVPRSLGGKVSLDNSVALCGDGVRGCHGFCQRHEIRIGRVNGEWIFAVASDAAAEWVGR